MDGSQSIWSTVAKLKKVANSLDVHECTLEEGSCMYMSHAPDFVLALVCGATCLELVSNGIFPIKKTPLHPLVLPSTACSTTAAPRHTSQNQPRMRCFLAHRRWCGVGIPTCPSRHSSLILGFSPAALDAAPTHITTAGRLRSRESFHGAPLHAAAAFRSIAANLIAKYNFCLVANV